MVTIEQVRDAAGDGQWGLAQVERVLRMAELLAACASHPRLRDVLAIKGGTALNLLDHDMPRLSVDLDFNVVGAWAGEELDEVRTAVREALQVVAHRLALVAREARASHAGSTWRLTYDGVVGSGNVEIDLNFLHRVPLVAPRRVTTRVLGSVEVREVLAVAPAELVAGKLGALLDRTHPRDVWDAALLDDSGALDDPSARRCFVVYLAGARRPWRELLAAPIRLDPNEVERLLVPMLRADHRPAALDSWSAELVERVEQAVAPLRIPADDEVAFLDAVTERGEIDPGLLGIEPEDPMHDAILRSPPLAWKARNVREARGG